MFRGYFIVILGLKYETVLTHLYIKITIFFKWPQLGSVNFVVVLKYLNKIVAITALGNVGL